MGFNSGFKGLNHIYKVLVEIIFFHWKKVVQLSYKTVIWHSLYR